MNYAERADLLASVLSRCQRQPNGCLDWLGATNSRGYGCIRVDGEMWLVHRLMWELVRGPIPAGLHCLHSCDRPPCVEITHLEVGTNRKNMEQRNLIVPLVGDFGGPKTIRAVGQYLRDHESTVEAFYVSNVEQYLFQSNPTAVNGGSQNFYNSVATLPLDSTSTFIRSSNTTDVKQPYVGFTSLLGSMTETIQAFKQRGFSNLRDVFALSH